MFVPFWRSVVPCSHSKQNLFTSQFDKSCQSRDRMYARPHHMATNAHEVRSGSLRLSNMPKFLPTNRGFKMACLNINGLVKHSDELRVLLAEFSFVILGINETKLEESIKSSELHIPS